MIQEPHKVSRVEAANRQLEATIALCPHFPSKALISLS